MRNHRKIALALAAAVIIQIPNVDAMEDRGSKADQDACTPDVFSLCSGSIPDEPAILACLLGHKADLSPPCAKVLFPPTAARRKHPVRG